MTSNNWWAEGEQIGTLPTFASTGRKSPSDQLIWAFQEGVVSMQTLLLKFSRNDNNF